MQNDSGIIELHDERRGRRFGRHDERHGIAAYPAHFGCTALGTHDRFCRRLMIASRHYIALRYFVANTFILPVFVILYEIYFRVRCD